ncbi:heavy metal translocating P-type ATPase [Propionispora vibrioides]|uniref:Cd(2+)-exporting ATPase n=1 Tax=Propionispora vibrioides TaxID=112903 RepID=A0A1H8V1A8_9FIRM|nr:heavy metal translocating P-type ATPase [Propionispora vibrioides]SEP09023.1 Cd2+/Zn2+-exporting ATPase [Propionispora vibrioides]
MRDSHSESHEISCRRDCCDGRVAPAAAICSCSGESVVAVEPDTADCCRADCGPAVTADQAIARFTLEGLDCGDCAAKLEKALSRLTGVSQASVSFATAKLQVTYDPELTDTAAILAAVRGFGYTGRLLDGPGQVTDRKSMVFVISGMDCADCAKGLEKRISKLTGVYAAQVNFATGKLLVEHSLPVDAIYQAVEQAGYKARLELKGTDVSPGTAWWKHARTGATALAGILLVVATLANWLGCDEAVVSFLYVAAAVAGGYHTARSGLYGVRSLTFDMNFLMTIAVLGAFAIGEGSEGATVAFLFSFGNTLQAYTVDKTRQSIRALMELAPPEALVLRNGQELRLPVEEIVVGDILLVKPGERIAMDGIVAEGISAVNQAAITGESIPVEKQAGDTVYAGTLNENGALSVRVTRAAGDSTLARIMKLVEEAQAQKAPSQQFVDVFSKYYTPAVLLGALGVMLIPWLAFGLSFTEWFYKGLVLLVISCPCALVISTPVSIVAAIGNASANGVLIKGGAYLEELGAIEAIAFDKTGTLTTGQPVVTGLLPVQPVTEQELLQIAASIEKFSEHPLAAAILQKAAGLSLLPAKGFTALVGRGAQAELAGNTVYIGNRRLMEELGLSTAVCEPAVTTWQQQGKTVMFVGNRQELFGVIAVADTVRDNAGEAIAALRRTGMKHTAMLTGDQTAVAAWIAGSLQLDSYYSELLPEDKVAIVKKLAADYGRVVMVGDGVNDAPALAAANIGIAMGVAGSDTALETADVALMADDLGKLSYVMRLSRKTVAIIKQNIGFSVLIKALFIWLTLAGHGNLWMAVFADTGSSILVTLNGMRLMRKLA